MAKMPMNLLDQDLVDLVNNGLKNIKVSLNYSNNQNKTAKQLCIDNVSTLNTAALVVHRNISSLPTNMPAAGVSLLINTSLSRSYQILTFYNGTVSSSYVDK